MEKMECRDYEKQVQSFLRDEMKDADMQTFMEHVQICPRCYEELEIYHSVFDGLELMEQGEIRMENMEFADARLRYLLEKRRQRIIRNKIKHVVLWILLGTVCMACMIGIGSFI